MKKVFLVLVCALVLTVFIAFNYLLWDRENNMRSIESLNSSKNMQIDMLNQKIKAMEYLNKQLQENINDLSSESKDLQSRKGQLEKEISTIRETLDQRNSMINKLKQKADLKLLEQTIQNWADGIDKGYYEVAYELQSGQERGNPVGLADFTGFYKSTIKEMKVKTFKLNVDETSSEKRGTVVFDVVLNVKKIEGTAANSLVISPYSDGMNERFFTLIYDEQKAKWVISYISTSP